MSSGADADWLSGGLGADILRGGGGADIFAYARIAESTGGENQDSILDWQPTDRIDLSLVDADSTRSGVQSFAFLGLLGNDRAVGQGELRYFIENGNSYIVGNSGPNGVSEFQIELRGVHAITSEQVRGLDTSVKVGSDGADNITGSGGADVVFGAQGDDLLDGGTGADVLFGGGGNDTFIVDRSDDVVIEGPGLGLDTIRTTVSYRLGSQAYIETLGIFDASTVNSANLTGNGLANALIGNSGANVLDGGGGSDRLSGGLGNDTYITDGSDVVIEAADAGTDTVLSSVRYTLRLDFEDLTLTGTAAIGGTGNIRNNVLRGNAAANSLDGGGGADTLIGGLGNDTYVTDGGGDTITEAAGGGTDTVRTSVSLTLAVNVESLTLLGTAAINGEGNAGANTLTGNGAANFLSGRGGTDILIGGLGNDTYVTDGSDTISEAADAGTDLVRSSVAHTLGANLENLILLGSVAINGTGNAGSNTLIGNGAANVLSGWDGNDKLNGAGGLDSLVGGVGNDIYITDGDDTLTEASGGGTDLVQSSATFILAANFESLTLTGTSAINGYGNSGSNALRGNTGNNVLSGARGIDILLGGAGNDRFVFGAKEDSGVGAARDVINDFEDFGGNDTIDLSAFAGTLTYIGQSAFTAANQVRAIQAGASVLIEINTSGTSGAESEILLKATTIGIIDAGDFIG